MSYGFAYFYLSIIAIIIVINPFFYPHLKTLRSMTVGGVTFSLEQQSKDPQSAVYTGLYSTEGVNHTKSGERQPVQISIEVK